MKVISLQQPWASLLVRGYKKNETRSFATKYRGPLLIHASAKFLKENKALLKTYPFNVFAGKSENMPLGAIIGCVNLRFVTSTNDALLIAHTSRLETLFGDYSDHRYAWRCDKFQVFKDPIPAKGQLGFWNYDGLLPELSMEPTPPSEDIEETLHTVFNG